MLMSTFYNAINQVDSVFSLKVIILQKKSHTFEEGGAHLKIAFWYLLMNSEKPEKADF